MDGHILHLLQIFAEKLKQTAIGKVVRFIGFSSENVERAKALLQKELRSLIVRQTLQSPSTLQKFIAELNQEEVHVFVFSKGVFIQRASQPSNTGLPNVRPRGRMRPPGLFYAAPGPFSKNRAGHENYVRYLLLVHFHISIADFLYMFI